VDALRAQVAANAPAEAPQQATADSETAEVAEVVAEDQSSPDAGIEPTTEPAPAGE
jgi:hypothetical protein